MHDPVGDAQETSWTKPSWRIGALSGSLAMSGTSRGQRMPQVTAQVRVAMCVHPCLQCGSRGVHLCCPLLVAVPGSLQLVSGQRKSSQPCRTHGCVSVRCWLAASPNTRSPKSLVSATPSPPPPIPLPTVEHGEWRKVGPCLFAPVGSWMLPNPVQTGILKAGTRLLLGDCSPV